MSGGMSGPGWTQECRIDVTSAQRLRLVLALGVINLVLASVVLGFGRAIGETMIVLMASGNAAVTSMSPTSSGRTLTATIAAELGEAPRGGEHWRVLFALGLLLFLTTFVLDQLGQRAVRRLKRRFGPSPGDEG